jgi:hypothetical protein
VWSIGGSYARFVGGAVSTLLDNASSLTAAKKFRKVEIECDLVERRSISPPKAVAKARV